MRRSSVPPRCPRNPPLRQRHGAQGRQGPHPVHHRPGAPGRFPGLRADQPQPRLRRAARRQAAAAGASRRAPVGLIKSFRGGLSAPGKARVVIDVTGPVDRREGGRREGEDGKTARLVLEIVPAEIADDGKPPTPGAPAAGRRLGLGAGGLQPPMPRPAVSPQQRALSMYKPVIVLDPGHGGDDTGATKSARSRRTWCSRSASSCATSCRPPAATRC